MHRADTPFNLLSRMLRPTLGLVRHRLQSRRRRHYPWIALASRKGGGGFEADRRSAGWENVPSLIARDTH